MQNIYKQLEVWDINLFNKNSIFLTLSISLVITILLLFISFFTINEIDKKNNFDNLKRKYSTITKIVNQEYARFGFTNDLRRMIEEMDLILIDDSKKIQRTLQKTKLELMIKRRYANILLHIFKDKNHNILHFQTPFEEFLIIDHDIQSTHYHTFTILVFAILLLTILFVAYSVYKKLAPLYELHSKIDHIGNPNMSLDFLQTNAKDEVSLLARALLEKSQNLNQLKTSRDIFIRNIMHELKTPITKGRFLLELESNQTNKEKLQKVFYQLESLISEFASIEEVIAKKQNIEKKDIFFDDILENTLDMLMLENETDIEIDNHDFKLFVNFKLFSIAVKNLIDNGLKYSNNHKVSIKIEHNAILFINQGKPLEHSLEKYYEPFFSNSANNKGSFGLGFYIIKSILDVHNFKLNYTHQENNNIFTIVL